MSGQKTKNQKNSRARVGSGLSATGSVRYISDVAKGVCRNQPIDICGARSRSIRGRRMRW